ncbi:MAG: HU family DNA-binding protein [Bacteroidaceae bacterium]|nr:HU family DNA-binding protein [Bacteroidaceae bacterium]
MNDKLSFQNIVDALTLKAGVSKKVAETFSKAFFDTIVEALYMGEESIKVKGLGVFKLVSVESRESVNVTNGERIVIPGYKKVSFTPEDAVVDFLNKDAKEENVVEEVVEIEKPAVTEEAVATVAEEAVATIAEEAFASVPEEVVVSVPEETPDVEEEVPQKEEETPLTVLSESAVFAEVPSAIVPEKSEVDDLIQVPVPEHVETAQDEFGGIDMLISTPESIDEVRRQYEEAKEKMDAAIEEARKASSEKLRLEKLLERLEANTIPESEEEPSEEGTEEEETSVSPEVSNDEKVEENVEVLPIKEETEQTASPSPHAEEERPASSSTPSIAERREAALKRYMREHPDEDDDDDDDRSFRRGYPFISLSSPWFAIPLILLLGVIVYFLYQTSMSIESVERMPRNIQTIEAVKEKDVPNVENVKEETKAAVAEQDSVKVEQKQTDTEKVEKTETAEKKPERPATYIMQKGESLTRISQRFYGTKDSVNAIIRANKFADPNNVPVGATIKLP